MPIEKRDIVAVKRFFRAWKQCYMGVNLDEDVFKVDIQDG